MQHERRLQMTAVYTGLTQTSELTAEESGPAQKLLLGLTIIRQYVVLMSTSSPRQAC